MVDKRELCQCCGELIDWNCPVIAVRYGIISKSVRHTTVSKERVDYFHPTCEVGVNLNHEYKKKKAIRDE